jgi:hypothetical protein
VIKTLEFTIENYESLLGTVGFVAAVFAIDRADRRRKAATS